MKKSPPQTKIIVCLVALTLPGTLCIRWIQRPSTFSDKTSSEISIKPRTLREPNHSGKTSSTSISILEQSSLARDSSKNQVIDPRNPFSSLTGLSGVELKDAKIELIHQIAERSDPETLISLLNYLMSNESEEIGVHGAISCIPKLFRKGNAEVTEWMKTLGDNSMSNRYLSVAASMLGNFSTSDDALLSLLAAPGETREWRNIILDSYTVAKAEQDPISALSLYFKNTENAQVNTVDGIISRLHGREQVIEFLGAIKDWPDSDHKRNAEASAFNAWAQKEPIEAANAAKDLSPHSLQRVMQAWGTSDLNEALQWLKSLQSGQARDNSIIGLSSNLVIVDPGNATALAFSLDDEQLRQTQTESMFRRWSSHNPAAALQWAERSGFQP